MARHSNGWVKVHRKLTSPDSDIGTNGYRLAILVTLIAWANRDESTIQFNGKPRKITRGQVVIGLRDFAEHLGFSKDTVFRQLQYLCLRDTICKEAATEGTLITITNYEQYQDNLNDARQDCDKGATDAGLDSGRQPNASEPPNGEEKNRRREEYIYPSDFEEFWNQYPEGVKQAAFRAYKKQIKTEADRERLRAAITNYFAECAAKKSYKKHFSSFLGSDRTQKPWVEFVERKPGASSGDLDWDEIFGGKAS